MTTLIDRIVDGEFGPRSARARAAAQEIFWGSAPYSAGLTLPEYDSWNEGRATLTAVLEIAVARRRIERELEADVQQARRERDAHGNRDGLADHLLKICAWAKVAADGIERGDWLTDTRQDFVDRLRQSLNAGLEALGVSILAPLKQETESAKACAAGTPTEPQTERETRLREALAWAVGHIRCNVPLRTSDMHPDFHNAVSLIEPGDSHGPFEVASIRAEKAESDREALLAIVVSPLIVYDRTEDATRTPYTVTAPVSDYVKCLDREFRVPYLSDTAIATVLAFETKERAEEIAVRIGKFLVARRTKEEKARGQTPQV